MIRYAYAEIARLARANGSTLIIAIMGNHEPISLDPDLLPLNQSSSAHPIGMVNTRLALINALEDKTHKEYLTTYNHTAPIGPDQVVVVDDHPNARAHAIIAEQLALMVEEIESLITQPPPKQGNPPDIAPAKHPAEALELGVPNL